MQINKNSKIEINKQQLQSKKENLYIDMESGKIYYIKNLNPLKSDISKMLYIFLKHYKHIIGQKIIDYRK